MKRFVMEPGRSFWEVDGRNRDCSILIGRTPVNVKLARKRKEQKNTGFSTAQNGTMSDETFEKFFGKLEQKARTSKKEWKWQRVLLNILSVREAQELGIASRRLQGPRRH